jgi:hypothetical protein
VTATMQLLAFRFGPGAAFEGQLVGALERMESGGALRVAEILFVGRDPDSSELVAVSAHGRQQGSLVAGLLGFRLEQAERARATERALAAYDREGASNPLRELAGTLEPGGAIAAVLVEHRWTGALDDAVARVGGGELLGGFVEAAELSELAHELLAAARR